MRKLLIVMALLSFSSCETNLPPDTNCISDCSSNTIDACKKMWTLSGDNTLKATIDNKALSLSMNPTLPATTKSLTYTPIIGGDFYIRLAYNGFSPGMIGSFAQAMVKTDSGYYSQASISTQTNSMTPWIVATGFFSPPPLPNGQQAFNNTNITDKGIIEFRRVNQELITSITPENSFKTEARDYFPNSPVKLILQLGSFANAGLTGPASLIQLTEITVTSESSNLHKDSLTCNSIAP